MLFNFGQPESGIIQSGFIVEDMKKAIDYWVDILKVGPWYYLDSFFGEDPVYRGTESKAETCIAMAFAGHMQIELIQPKDEHPSVYKEYKETRGFGFHHYGIASHDFDADRQRLEAKGYELAFVTRVPTGDRVGYFDTHGLCPFFVELIEISPSVEGMFTSIYRSSLGWDGADPIRPFG